LRLRFLHSKSLMATRSSGTLAGSQLEVGRLNLLLSASFAGHGWKFRQTAKVRCL